MQLPLVVDKTRTKTIGAERTTSQQVGIFVDLQKQSAADIHNILIETIGETTAAQIRMGNEPNFILVDGKEKPLRMAYRKVEVFYGAFLQRALMAVIEIELRRAILATTTARTGSLANIRQSWEWVLISGGTRTTLGGPQDIKQFNPGDSLILTPKVGYAGRVNSLVARSRSGRGFLLDAVDKLRRKTAWRAFAIKVGFSRAHVLPDEIQRGIGTPFISVKMARARYRRRG